MSSSSPSEQLVHSKILPEYCTSGRPLEAVNGVVLHYFSGRNVDVDNQFDMAVCRNLFLDLNRAKSERQFYMRESKWPDGRMYASAHVLIGRDGEIWKLVEFDKQAYHAGASILNGRANCNRWTLGVELIGTVESGFSEAQYAALAILLADLRRLHQFDLANIAGHDSVRWAAIQEGAKKRPKYDPSGRKDGLGDNFDWTYFGRLLDDELAEIPTTG